MAQRFGTPSGKAESGTKEEFDLAMASHKATGFPEIKWFFRKVDKLEFPTDPEQAMAALAQWQQVLAFRKEVQDLNDPVFYTEYPGEPASARSSNATSNNGWPIGLDRGLSSNRRSRSVPSPRFRLQPGTSKMSNENSVGWTLPESTTIGRLKFR